MHPSALKNGALFFSTYMDTASSAMVLDIGSLDVNGSLRELVPQGVRYTGLDFEAGPGVDRVLEDAYQLPFADSSVDAVVSSSCFEHIEMFWLMFNEIMRVLKPHGLFYLNAPSNGEFHRYPVDCWRFYPDAGMALVRWANRSGYRPAMLESFTTYQQRDIWNDFVAVFVKDISYVGHHSKRMIDQVDGYMNGRRHGVDGILRHQTACEDGVRLAWLTGHAKPLS